MHLTADMMMDSDSVYKPNGDYLISPYSWHTAQDLQQFTNAPLYSYGDYGPVVVKSEYDDCDGGDGGGIGGGGGVIDGCDGSGGGSSSSPSLQEHDLAEPKKGILFYNVKYIK